MRSLVRATAVALGLTVVAGVAKAQAGSGKIVFVNSAALMEAAPGKDSAQAMLTREGNALQLRLQKMEDSLNAMMTKYQKDEPTLTAAVKKTRQEAITGLQTSLQAENLKMQQQWQQRQSEVMAPITDKVKQVLDEIRAQEGYAMILDNAPGASIIVSADKNLDITDKVVSRLRATAGPTLPAAKAGAPAAPAGVTRPPTKPPTQ